MSKAAFILSKPDGTVFLVDEDQRWLGSAPDAHTARLFAKAKDTLRDRDALREALEEAINLAECAMLDANRGGGCEYDIEESLEELRTTLAASKEKQ